jgi:RND superfamily putative drug exporter
MFARLGRWCYDHRWKVIISWVAVLVVGNGILGAVGGAQTNADFSLPDVESKRGTDILEESFGGQGAGFGGTIVFQADQGVDDPEVEGAMESFLADIEEVDGVARVSSPYGEEGEGQIAQEGPDAGRIAYAQVDMDPDLGENEFTQVGTDIRELWNDLDEVEGLQVELGGAALAEFEVPNSELLGVAFAIVILILAFGSVLAMGLPIGMAITGIGVGTLLAGFLSFIVDAPSFASIFGIMIGLGVGIDYALFIVTRYRENLHKGYDTRTSVGIALDTAGRAVIFAGTTVVISLLGMVLMGLSFITGMAIAIATVVAATMVASVTLLPALMGFAGTNIERTRWRGLIAAGFVALVMVGAGMEFIPLILAGAVLAVVVIGASFFVAPLKQEVPRREPKPLRETVAYRWSRVIQHHPWASVLSAVAVLVLLALPVFRLDLGFSDEGNYPADTTTRRAYDLLADGFGPGHNGPLMLAAELPPGTPESQLEDFAAAIEQTDGVASVSFPFVSDDGDAVAWQVIPTTSPQDDVTADLVAELRDEVVPAATEGTELDVAVAGQVAVMTDFAHYLSERLPYFFGAVLVLSFLLLMTVFRSILVPLKAVVMNLLSIGAAYGVMVVGFQWGWLGGVLNFEGAPIEPWMPMMLFAIVFGLSMDYEVFLLSRVKEEWDRTGDSRTSVADGLAATARVITAAALIMVFVFGAFLFEPDRVVKLMGVGLATAVLLDASIIRMLLVPATMELLGDRNWWLPGWLDRILPKIQVEGHAVEPPPPEVEREPERELV